MGKEASIEIGVVDRLGNIIRAISLAVLVATGDSYQIHLMNGGKVGSNDYELLVQHEEQIEEKARLGRLKRERLAR